MNKLIHPKDQKRHNGQFVIFNTDLNAVIDELMEQKTINKNLSLEVKENKDKLELLENTVSLLMEQLEKKKSNKNKE